MDFGKGQGHTGFVLKVLPNRKIQTIEGIQIMMEAVKVTKFVAELIIPLRSKDLKTV